MSTNDGLVLPENAPAHRFMRYVRAPQDGHEPLFPLVPAVRALKVGVDLSTLGPETPDSEDFVSILRRRPEVDTHLLVFGERDGELTDPWTERAATPIVHVVDYDDPEQLEKIADASQVWVTTYKSGEFAARWWCPFFGVYTQLDALQAAKSDLAPADRSRAAALSAVGLKLGLDVIVTNAPTAGRPDVADNDTTITVPPADLLPIFGHYLRMTGNRSLRYNRSGAVVIDPLIVDSMMSVYQVGVESHVRLLRVLTVKATMDGHNDVVADIRSISGRARRALRALDELLAALSNHRSGTQTSDTGENVSEAFDRELLYLTAIFDTLGRLFRRLLDGTVPQRNEPKSLYSKAFVDRYITARYSPSDVIDRIVGYQPYAAITSKLRNYIHEAVLPTGPYLSHGYGNASVIAVDLNQLDVELTQPQAEKLGIWSATTDSPWAPPTTVGDLATLGVTLMTTALDYTNAVVELVLFQRPTDDSAAHPLLGCAPEFPAPAPRPDEILIRRYFGW